MSERNIDWLPLLYTPTRKNQNLGMCPDQELNWCPFALWDDTQPSETHQAGHMYNFFFVNIL